MLEQVNRPNAFKSSKKLAREFHSRQRAWRVASSVAMLGEVFGELDKHSKLSMPRKMFIKVCNCPSQVEFRVHLMRAGKINCRKALIVLC